VSAVVVLDASPLGILFHPRNPPPVAACRQWLVNLSAAGRRVVLPEIADYEVRRELIRLSSRNALINLDQLGTQLEYLPLSTTAMRLAAELWAQARGAGRPTAPDPALDADVILAAQAITMNTAVVVASANPNHIKRFVAAELWSSITP
jgi:predicted nucleic acid-binding protein